MGTLEDKIMGEKLEYYCSSSEDEDGPDVKFVPDAEVKDNLHWNGNAANTGPKGVIKDWQRFKQLESEKRDEQEKEKLALFKKLSITSKTKAEDEEAKKKEEELDLELEELMGDEFLLEYQKKRMAEMLVMSGMSANFGNLIELKNGDQFLEAIDNENKNITVVVHIYDKNESSCKMMNKALAELAKEYRQVKFCQIMTADAGMSQYFKNNGLPAILVYRAGQVIGNFVRLTDDLGDEFYQSDVESFLLERGMIPDKTFVPVITASSI